MAAQLRGSQLVPLTSSPTARPEYRPGFLLLADRQHFRAILQRRSLAHFLMAKTATTRIDQFKEWGMLSILYALSSFNAEMMRRSVHHDQALQTSAKLFAHSARWISDQMHPVMMVIGAAWMITMLLWIALGHPLPRWSFDAPGTWFGVRLLLEFAIINGLLFEPSLIQPGVLLGQIVVFLPYFVISWAWIFYRMDWVNKERSGSVVWLSDADQQNGFSRFDYLHSTINTLISKGKSVITGVSRQGRITVMIFNVMTLCLYAVAFARILQLTKATL